MTEPSSAFGKSNASLLRLLASLQGQSGGQLIMAPRYLSELHLELTRTARLLQQAGAASGSNAKDEQIECRANLERLQAALANLQARMLTERARLDRDRTHFEAAANWRRSLNAF